MKGKLRYKNLATGEAIDSEELIDLLVVGTTAYFSGTAMIGGSPATFSVEVSDQGEPGRADTFRIAIVPGSSAAGVLSGGNIQIHKRQ